MFQPKARGAKADPSKPRAEDSKELEGEWRTVEYEHDGKKSPSYEIRSYLEIWTFKGDEVSSKRVDGSDMEPGARFKLDPAKSPKAIDMTWAEGRLKGQISAGIYALEKGKLWLCTAPPWKDSSKRPTEFKTHKGDGVTLLVLERVLQKRPGSETDGPRPPGDKAADEFGTFLREWRQADQDFQGAYWKAKTPDERQTVMAEKKPKPGPFAERCLKLAETCPDTPAGVAALCWAVSNAPQTAAGTKALAMLQGGAIAHADPEDLMHALDSGRNLEGGSPKQLAPFVLARAKQALDHPRTPRLLTWVCTCSMHDGSAEPPPTFAEAADLIVGRFADNPDINWLCECLGGNGSVGPPWAVKYEKHLRTILAKNHHLRVRSTAQIALASVLQESGQEEEAMKIYEQFVKEYEKGAPNDPWNGILKQLVSHAKSELEGMVVRPLGGSAPAIEGEDLDGRPMKLADFRGKVVLISFWGSWCSPCMKLVPHERSLVERLKDKPFVLIGVNADEDPAELSKALEKNPMTWRSFKNKGAGKKTIAEEWKILGFPTLYLIDHKGIIRKRWIGAPPTADLGREIDKLVQAALTEK